MNPEDLDTSPDSDIEEIISPRERAKLDVNKRIEMMKPKGDAVRTPLCAAIKDGRLDQAIRLLSFSFVDPSICGDHALRLAVEHGHLEIVKLLLADPRVNPNASSDNTYAPYVLSLAVQNGHFDVFHLLLQDPRLDPSMYENDALERACRFGYIDLVKLLLNDSRLDPSGWSYCFRYSCNNGNMEIFQLLLADSRCSKEDITTGALFSAIVGCHSDIVQMVLKDPRVDLSLLDLEHAFLACDIWNCLSYEGLDIVTFGSKEQLSCSDYRTQFDNITNIYYMLLQDCRVNKADLLRGYIRFVAVFGNHKELQQHLNETRMKQYGEFSLGGLLFDACRCGHLENVSVLLTDHRAFELDEDMGFDYRNALPVAAYNGHLEVVELLLKDPRFDPSNQNNLAFRCAAGKDCVEVAKLLLKDPRVDPSDYDNEAIRSASKGGFVELVRLLLEDVRVDPTVFDCASFHNAVYSGQLEVVDILLKDGRIDPAIRENASLRGACLYGYDDVIDRLLRDNRIGLSAFDNQAICAALFGRRFNLAKQLLNHHLMCPRSSLSGVFISACSSGCEELVVSLLENHRVDPSYKDNKAFIEAAKAGRAKIVALLLKDPRVDPTALNSAVRIAVGLKSPETMRVLLSDPRVDLCKDYNDVLKAEISSCSNSLFLLLREPRLRISEENLLAFCKKLFDMEDYDEKYAKALGIVLAYHRGDVIWKNIKIKKSLEKLNETWIYYIINAYASEFCYQKLGSQGSKLITYTFQIIFRWRFDMTHKLLSDRQSLNAKMEFAWSVLNRYSRRIWRTWAQYHWRPEGSGYQETIKRLYEHAKSNSPRK